MEAIADDPFTRFDEWLDRVEAAVDDRIALLSLDEFKVLDQTFTTGRFSEAAILGMLRNWIQHRSRFKVLLAGAHSIQEFQRWSRYLINVQTIHLGYLEPEETRKLIEDPIPDFALRYEAIASQRVLGVTRGHPYLVQSLCAEIVALKNEQPASLRWSATLADVEAAILPALSSGEMFFRDIKGNQVDDEGQLLLRYLASQGENVVVNRATLMQAHPQNLEEVLDLLL